MKYYIRTFDWPEDVEEIEASSIESAAEQYAENFHSESAYESIDEPLVIEISESKDGLFEEYSITATMYYHFSASKVKRQ